MKTLLDAHSAKLAPLLGLREAFRQNGFDIRLVGGCVRDMLCGLAPKDFDLCTDADPHEQRAIYQAAGIRHIDTGLQHGTWTVVIDGEGYEVTSLRTETDHDGRHAKVAYTRDWLLDLSRRDLTINAMALTLDGDLIDPYGGSTDLANGRVMFVGNPEERIREDYLRILRWLRFHARFGKGAPLDVETCQVAKKQTIRVGLFDISRERIWSEMSRIVTGPHALAMINAVYDLDLAWSMALPPLVNRGNEALENAVAAKCSAPAIMAALAAGFSTDHDHLTEVEHLAERWKWSTAERDEAHVVVRYGLCASFDLNTAMRAAALDGVRTEWLVQALLVCGLQEDAQLLRDWPVPAFPVGGDDLIALGMRPGPEMGKTLRRLRERWAVFGYDIDKAALLGMV